MATFAIGMNFEIIITQQSTVGLDSIISSNSHSWSNAFTRKVFELVRGLTITEANFETVSKNWENDMITPIHNDSNILVTPATIEKKTT